MFGTCICFLFIFWTSTLLMFCSLDLSKNPYDHYFYFLLNKSLISISLRLIFRDLSWFSFSFCLEYILFLHFSWLHIGFSALAKIATSPNLQRLASCQKCITPMSPAKDSEYLSECCTCLNRYLCFWCHQEIKVCQVLSVPQERQVRSETLRSNWQTQGAAYLVQLIQGRSWRLVVFATASWGRSCRKYLHDSLSSQRTLSASRDRWVRR